MAANELSTLLNAKLNKTGDLAFKKTYPALFGLFKNKFLPINVQIVGYARSHIEHAEFLNRISSKIKTATAEDQKVLQEFLTKCTYFSGKYDEVASFEKLNVYLDSVEKPVPGQRNRIFYMALPPSVFIPASSGLRLAAYSKKGNNRLIVEKPFGKDYNSSKELSQALAKHWAEDEVGELKTIANHKHEA
jgi:glucose-6-phosphate 1-dehydrogenase